MSYLAPSLISPLVPVHFLQLFLKPRSNQGSCVPFGCYILGFFFFSNSGKKGNVTFTLLTIFMCMAQQHNLRSLCCVTEPRAVPSCRAETPPTEQLAISSSLPLATTIPLPLTSFGLFQEPHISGIMQYLFFMTSFFHLTILSSRLNCVVVCAIGFSYYFKAE